MCSALCTPHAHATFCVVETGGDRQNLTRIRRRDLCASPSRRVSSGFQNKISFLDSTPLHNRLHIVDGTPD